MHANPYLRSLQLTAIDARRARPAALAPTPAAAAASASDRPTLAAVADLPLGTPLAELCETVELRCPSRDGRGRVYLRKLFGDLSWHPDGGTRLDVVVAGDRPGLWLDGAAPARPDHDCNCQDCGRDHTPPADRTSI